MTQFLPVLCVAAVCAAMAAAPARSAEARYEMSAAGAEPPAPPRARDAAGDDGGPAAGDALLAQQGPRAGKGGAAGGARGRAEGSRFSHRLDARLGGGYDDNPLKLARNVRSAAFSRARLRYLPDYRLTGTLNLFGAADYRASMHEDGADGANRRDGRVTLGITDRSLRTGSGAIRSSFGATYGFRRMTFIDNRTGVEAVSNGTAIGDRFDANWYEIFARYRAPVGGTTSLLLDLTGHFEDYTDDFTELGLDRLDYREVTVEPGIRHKLGEALTLRVVALYTKRYFVDRRADDLDGNPIVGTDLAYTYFGVKARAVQRYSARLKIGAGAEVVRRVDNETGFGNRTTIEAGARVAYAFAGGHEVEFLGQWSRREFDNIDFGAIDETNDGGRKKQGYRLWLTYVAERALFGVDLFLRARRESFTNSDLDFEYTRHVVSGGVRARF